MILPNTADQIILGSEISDISINFFIVLIKYYIYSCKCTGTNLSPLGAQTMLKQTYLIEKLLSTFSQSPAVGQKITLNGQILNNCYRVIRYYIQMYRYSNGCTKQMNSVFLKCIN